jgi:hypothetical protein
MFRKIQTLLLVVMVSSVLGGWGADYIGCPIPVELIPYTQPWTEFAEHDSIRLDDYYAEVHLHQYFAEVFLQMTFVNDGSAQSVEMSYPVNENRERLFQSALDDLGAEEITPEYIETEGFPSHRAAWPMAFEAGETRIVSLYYFVGYGSGSTADSGRCSFSLSDAAYWHGAIGEGKVQFIFGKGIGWNDVEFFIGNGGGPLSEEDAVRLPWETEVGDFRYTISFQDFEPNTDPTEHGELTDPLLNLSFGFEVQHDSPPTEVRLTADSTLLPEEGHSYEAQNILVDSLRFPSRNAAPFGDPWVEGIAGDGEGQTLTLSFAEPTLVEGVTIYNGYFSDRNLYRQNGRAKRLIARAWGEDTTAPMTGTEVIFNEVPSYTWDWNFPGTAYLDFGAAVEVTRIELILDSVYPGSRWDDTCIGGVEVNYAPTVNAE